MSDMTVLIADDHPIYLEGLANLLQTYSYRVIASAGNGIEAVEKALSLKPDVILMDAQMPETNGIEATKIIKEKAPEIKILILTSVDDDELLFSAIRAGASGFLIKNLDGDELNRSLQELKAGKNPFSPGLQDSLLKEFSRVKNGSEKKQGTALVSKRHFDILEHISNGLTYKEIGDIMHISERTVKYHIRKIKDSYNLKNQIQMVKFYNDISS